MRFRAGKYTSDNSDLLIHIHKVRYTSDTYIKVKASLINKHNGILYESKNYKIYLKNITHWKIV